MGFYFRYGINVTADIYTCWLIMPRSPPTDSRQSETQVSHHNIYTLLDLSPRLAVVGL